TARELLSATLVAGHPGGRATQTSVSARGRPGRGYEQRGHRGYRDRDTRERLPECRDRQVSSVSCAWAGACQAGGCYADSSSYRQAFIVSQVNGTWGTAVEVPAPDSLNAGGNARIRAGTCVNVAHLCAGRLYRDLARRTGWKYGWRVRVWRVAGRGGQAGWADDLRAERLCCGTLVAGDPAAGRGRAGAHLAGGAARADDHDGAGGAVRGRGRGRGGGGPARAGGDPGHPAHRRWPGGSLAELRSARRDHGGPGAGPGGAARAAADGVRARLALRAGPDPGRDLRGGAGGVRPAGVPRPGRAGAGGGDAGAADGVRAAGARAVAGRRDRRGGRVARRGAA